MIEDSQTGNLPEFVGTAIGDTVGIVIANLDENLRQELALAPQFKSIGMVSARIGGGTHAMAADAAVKATNAEIARIELCRDTKGGAGHGISVIFASADVTDSRKAVEIMLQELEDCFRNVYTCEAGHVEIHYTARASQALSKAFNAPEGKAFGITVGAPAAVGMLMADAAMKAGNVEMNKYASSTRGTAFTNEVIISFSGDAAAVKQSLSAARQAGLAVLRNMGHNPQPMTSRA
ncbi:propanediol utilization microcompartment protein PduB [Aminipila butyrica]|uniref:Propanediol utilization microcompartment protein PduB n=1 Tax=Aminipila butyrica TaxID=433296 RepID=A0A858BV71_9FIRM|nr:propanediol utilization microcompartment protein PduB [Aminipila butyrica]QIB69951.1 propanediol utilization microcompartment protein PduB [Aminipila butyrica]